MLPLRVMAVAALAFLGTGCNDDGRDLVPAPTVAATAPAVADVPADDAGLSLFLPDLPPSRFLPAEHTCDGEDIAPAFSLIGVPESAAALAVSLVDIDADGYVHWVFSGLSASTLSVAAGADLPDVVYGRTDGGVLGWQGPCPPMEEDAHRYVLTLYVLAEPIGLAPDLDGRTAIAVIEEAAVETAQLEVLYSRIGNN